MTATETDDRSLLQVLLEYQSSDSRNYLSEENLKKIALEMGLSRSRVYSTASFYSEISLEPRGKHLVRLCCNAPCENAGKKELHDTLCDELGISVDETTGDGAFTLENVQCLGACYMSPAMKIDDRIYGNLTPHSAVEIIREIQREDRK